MSDYDLTTEEGRENFAAKVEWEGGLWEAVSGDGLRPDGPAEMRDRIHRWVLEGEAIEDQLQQMGALGD